MKQIKNRYTGEVILEGEAESIREIIENNKGVSLQEADLWGAQISKDQIEDIIKCLGIIIL